MPKDRRDDVSPWTVNLLDATVRASPFARYAAMREQGSIGWNPRMGVWMAVGYAAAKEILSDGERFSSEIRGDVSRSLYGARTMIFSDEPVHARLRQEVSPGFTSAATRSLTASIRRQTIDLLDRAFAKPGFDFVADVAGPLPVMTVCELLGIPPADRAALNEDSDAIVSIGVAGGTTARVRHQAAARLRDYFVRHVRNRLRSGPSGDLLDLVCAARPDPADEEVGEMAAQCMLVLVAGHETTRSLLGNAVLSLVTLPGLRDGLKADPGGLPGAIEEFVRFTGTVHALRRWTRRTTRLDGHELAAGSSVIVLPAAANRDPETYERPDDFVLGRLGAPPPLAFGWGPHYCLGAPLARLELRVVLEELLGRSPLRLAVPEERIAYLPSLFVRGPAALALRPA